MRTNKSLKVTLIAFFVGSLSTYAQVTVGSAEAPEDGALFQVKNKVGITDDGDNSTKGLAFPRVALVSKTDLLPMISTGANTMQKKSHVGLVVYNTTITGGFEKGLYVWNGSEWTTLSPSEALTAENGITVGSDNKIKLGGKLSEATTIAQDVNNLTIRTGKGTFSINSLYVDSIGIAVGEQPTPNSVLRLKGNNQGFVLPRVELINGNDVTTVSVGAADKGLVVYHTGNDNLDEGIYSFNGIAWNQLISQLPPDIEPNVRELTTGFDFPQSPLSTDYTKLQKLPFETITINEPGSYVFLIRLAGKGTSANGFSPPSDIPAFLYLRKSTDPTGTYIDGQTCYLPYLRGGGSVGGVVTVVIPKCKSGDVIEVFGAKYQSAADVSLYSGTAPTSSRTSIIYWKL